MYLILMFPSPANPIVVYHGPDGDWARRYIRALGPMAKLFEQV